MILVTGGAGYIGSHVLLELEKTGEAVVVVDNLSTGYKDALLSSEAFEHCDLADTATLDRIFASYKPETVLHFAASINAPESVEKPLAYYTNNLVNTINLIDLCLKHTVQHFIFSSTAAVYGSVGEQPVTEEHPTAPLNPYGKSKRMSEQVLVDVAAVTPMRYAILRYFNVVGADPMGRIGQRTQGVRHLLRSCMDTALGKQASVPVYGKDYPTRDGTGVRDYIHVCDLATAHVLALSYLRSGGSSEIFNVGYGKGYSVLEVIRAVETVTEKKLQVEFKPRRPADAASVVADSSKLQRLTRWTPQFDALETIVSHAWAWEQSHT